jgi:hypothetical protein
MPILIQCTGCKRKLRVQNHLLGKTVKCPNCQTKFQAEQLGEMTPKPPGSMPAQQTSEEMATLLVPPVNPESAVPATQVLELSEPASTPPQSPGVQVQKPTEQHTAANVAVQAPPPTPPAPAPPPPFPTPALKVFTILGGIMLLTALVGLGLSWWVAAAVDARLSP